MPFPTLSLTSCAVLILSLFTSVAQAESKNGFDLDGALISPAEILHGGPARDGIPAIDRPVFVPAREVHFLAPRDRVLGLSRNGVNKAYPIAILNWHEIVNDRVGNEAVVISFCPLCGSGVAFAAEAAGQVRKFGVSGLLYNSDVLLYDRESESLWSQLRAQAISGPAKGQRLEVLPLSHTSWADWRQRHPDTLVLSTDTGHRRDYGRDPYTAYTRSDGLFFPVKNKDRRYHPKERVLGLELDGQFKAYPYSELARATMPLRDVFAGRNLKIRFDAEHDSASIHDESGKLLPAITAFWFAWYAFHPDTAVFRAAVE